MKWVVGVIVVLAIVVGAGMMWVKSKPTFDEKGIFEVAPQQTTQPSIAPEVTETVGGQVKEFTVEGKGFSFTPSEIRVKKGDTVRLTFKSGEGMHDLVIDELDVATNQIGEGEEEEVEFAADKAGTFEYYCSVANHRTMGMIGKLVVE